MADKTIATFTAEQAAAFFAGEELGQPHWTDPVTARRMKRQQDELRGAVRITLSAFNAALHKESPMTAERLSELEKHAFAGDPQSIKLMGVIIAELIRQGLA